MLLSVRARDDDIGRVYVPLASTRDLGKRPKLRSVPPNPQPPRVHRHSISVLHHTQRSLERPATNRRSILQRVLSLGRCRNVGLKVHQRPLYRPIRPAAQRPSLQRNLAARRVEQAHGTRGAKHALRERHTGPNGCGVACHISGVPHRKYQALRDRLALCGRRTRRLERLDSSLHTSPASIGRADSSAVGGIGSEVVKNDAMIRPGVCLLDYANVASTLRPILDATARVPRGHPRQPDRSCRRADGVITIVRVGEDRLGVDVSKVARRLDLRRQLGEQGRALYPVRFPANPSKSPFDAEVALPFRLRGRLSIRLRRRLWGN